MIYLDPKSDIAFKKLFGDIAHKNVLMSFLNSILERTGEQKIIDVVINDPNNLPEASDFKSSIVDVGCTDQAQNQYIIEMQVVTQKYYDIRAQYYGAVALSRQLKTKSKYEILVPVIFVGILDFSLFENPDYLSHHLILDAKTHKQELKKLEFHFVELKKFHKRIEELATIADRWIYFLRNAENFQNIPENLQTPELKEAFHILEKGNWQEKDLELYDRYLDYIRSDAGRFDAGVEEGQLKAKITIAQDMLLKNFDIEIVAQITKLSIEDIQALQKNKAQ